MANKKVEIIVHAAAGEEIYICGNIPQLGNWDPKKALALKKVNDGEYSITKMLPEGQMIQFKFLCAKDWKNVEKGMYGEELDNHILFLPVSEPQVYGVDKFGK